MSEKKGVGKTTVFFAIVSVMLGVLLIGAIANYSAHIVGGEDDYVTQLETWYANRGNHIAALEAQLQEHQTYYDNRGNHINQLEQQIQQLRAPNLIKLNWQVGDNRPWLQTPYLRITGYVVNIGTNPAYNVRIHVVAYQSGGVEAINTYINLGSISGEWWKTVNADVFYTGSALVSWTATLEWTT